MIYYVCVLEVKILLGMVGCCSGASMLWCCSGYGERMESLNMVRIGRIYLKFDIHQFGKNYHELGN